MTIQLGSRVRAGRSLDPRLFLTGPWVRILSLIALVALWQLASRYADPVVLPSPVRVARAFWQQLTGETLYGLLHFHVGMTLFRASVEFCFSMILGGIIGFVLGRFTRANNFFDGWVILGLNMPALVVGILCYIWFGLGEFALILAVVINKVPLVAITIREGAQSIQPDLLQVAQVYRVRRLTVLRKVYLPQLYPYIMASARAGLALIWKIVLVFELLGRPNGVGFMLSLHFSNFQVYNVLAYAFAFIIVVMLIEAIVLRPLERRATRWRL